MDPSGAHLHLSSEFITDTPLSIATWNTSSLFTRIFAHSPRHSRKRMFLEQLLRTVDIGVFQECRRCMGDLSELPATHECEGTFLPVDGDSATSRAGGLVIAVSRKLLRRASGRRFTLHQRGRAATLSLRLGHWVHITGVHDDPTLPLGARRRLLAAISAHLARQSGVKFVLGDFNFVAGGETRYDGDGRPTTADSSTAAYFDELFEGWAELHQPDMDIQATIEGIGRRRYCESH